MSSAKWDDRYLKLAKHVSLWSKDPSTKVGAVLVKANRIVSVGFNGFPRGVFDSGDRLKNRELKYKLIVHGEMNAIHFSHEPLDGATLYTWPFMPCSVCAGNVIQAGIRRVVTKRDNTERWQESFKLTKMMFDEAGVELVEY